MPQLQRKIKVSIIIISWNTKKLLGECLDSIREFAADLSYEVIIVDNASEDGSQEMVRKLYPEVHLIKNDHNSGFAKANNQAVKVSSGEYVLLLNSDARLTDSALQNLLELAKKNPAAGLIGARLLNPDGSFQASHSPFPTLWREFLILSGLGRYFAGSWYPSRGPQVEMGPQQVDYVEGACLFCLKDVYSQVGGLDEAYFMYAEEVDLCYAMKKAGYQVWYHPEACIIHHGGASSLNRRTQREGDLYCSRIRFFRKNYGKLQAGLLALMMYFFVIVKSSLYGFIHFLTAGEKSRDVISYKEFRQKLNEAN